MEHWIINFFSPIKRVNEEKWNAWKVSKVKLLVFINEKLKEV